MDESACQNLLEYAQNNANFSALSKMLCAKEKKDGIKAILIFFAARNYQLNYVNHISKKHLLIVNICY